MKRNVEIDDSLDERVQDAKTELEENISAWIGKENPGKEADMDALVERWYQGEDKETYGCDAMSEIADSNTPIHYSEIDGLYYLHGDTLEEAYRNAGIGNGDEENHRQVAIYCYISEALHESYRDMFERILEERESDNAVSQA